MKKTLLCLMLSIPMMATAGIPVVDASSSAMRAAEFVKNMAQLQTQYQNLVAQLKQQEATYKSIVGTRNVADLLNKTSKFLPADTFKTYENIRNGNNDGLLGDMLALQQKYNVSGTDTKAMRGAISNQSNQSKLRNEAIVNQAFQRANLRIQNLQQMMANIDATGDTKAAADLQNRINTEMSLIQVENQNIQLIKQAFDIEESQRAAQQREISKKWSSSSNQPTAFKKVFSK